MIKAIKKIAAPAKVNLCLHVVGKRDDGYHELAMLMQKVSLFDYVSVELIPGDKTQVDCPGLVLADGEVNIVAKAVELFRQHVASHQGVRVAVEKNIPAAAGLGGGSSDAAAVLLALNELLKTDLALTELMSLGLRLGADVPFFLYDQTAWATGVGECLEPWPGVPPVTLVLVNPGVAVSTAWVFQNLGLTRNRAMARIPRFPVGTSGLVCLLQNDLEVVTCQHYPVITTIKDRLLASGAMGALMSGSGPTVFGVFDNRSQAEEAARDIAKKSDWWVKVVDPL